MVCRQKRHEKQPVAAHFSQGCPRFVLFAPAIRTILRPRTLTREDHVTVSMVPCPHCGTPQSPDVLRCSACGGQIGVAPTADEPVQNLGQTRIAGTSGSAAAAPRPSQPPAAVPDGPGSAPVESGGGFKKTMLGMPTFNPPGLGAPGGATPTPAAAGSPIRAHNKTKIGVAPMAGPGQPHAPTGATSNDSGGGFKRTMLGVAPPDVLQQRLGPPAAGSRPPGATTQAIDPAAPPAAPNLGATQVQFSPAQPGSVPTGFNPSGTLPLDGDPARAGSAPPPAAGVPPVRGSQQKTVLGVATPGIAPIHPGQAKAPPAQAPAPPYNVASYPPPPVEPGFAPPVQPPQQPRRLLYAVFVGAFLLLALASLAAFYLLSSPFSVEAKVVLDKNGEEQLEVTCAECPNGTTSEINGQMTTFTSGKAIVNLADPLKVGNNSLSISLLKPGDNRAETLELMVPVQFRISGDLSGLANEPPTVRVSIQAIPGTTVVLDGSALKLDAGGTGEYTIDVSKELSGEATSVETFEKKVPYTITPPNASPEKGEVTMRASITPLTLDAPGPSIVIDKANFMLAGRTQKGGSVSVAGRAITVDPTGRFAQLMSVSSAGETTIVVRGSAKDLAPRLVPVRIRRVESLADETARLMGESRTPFGDFTADIEKSRGKSVLFDAVVVEARTDSHTTVMLLNVTSGCPDETCLARVIYGAKLSLKKDQAVTVSGTVAGTVDGPRSGTKLAELRADLVVRKAP